MGFTLEHNSLLVLSDAQLSEIKMQEGSTFDITKEGERLYPLNIPFEFCNSEYLYIGKIIVTKITIEKGKTSLSGKILKIFNIDESKVFTDNFISPDVV
ncbi:MAG: DUF2584 family protein [Candidatus Saccharibacteria bacterium]